MKLNIILRELANHGCYPGVYRRGNLWRAHVNCAGSHWHDDSTPLKAIQGAVKLWTKAGKPHDGMAADAAEGEE